MLENYITKEEISQPRTPKQFVSWFEEKLATTKQLSHALREQNLLHKGIAKYFYEELFPLYRLLQNKLEAWNDVEFIPILGNQNYDIEVKSDRADFLKYIEITQADMNEDEHFRMRYLLEHGSVNKIGKVSKQGTKRAGLKISVINEAKRHTELNLEKKNQIKKAIEDKQKVKRKPDNTALLVDFDDYIAYSQDEDRKEMNKFLDSVYNLWNKQYVTLFVVGASGKGCWEKHNRNKV